jgi:DnaD/phage-associated family protein
MPRPVKQIVDYFPHDADASSRKTITILESRYGAIGYTCWFKLLEQLAQTNGHVITCRNPIEVAFLQAKTLAGEKLIEILDLLASLEAIDAQLWTEKMIFSQNFVNNVSHVYKNRRQPVPTRPIITTPNNSATLQDSAITTPDNPITTTDNTHSRVEQSRVDKSRLITTAVRVENSENQKDTTGEFSTIVNCYEQNIGLLTPSIAESLKDISAQYPSDWFPLAVKEACKANVRRLSYVTAILERWKVQGIAKPHLNENKQPVVKPSNPVKGVIIES